MISYHMDENDGQFCQQAAELYARCFDKPWSMKEISGLLAGAGVEIAALADVRLTGFIMYRMAGPEGEILTLCVDPERHNSGLGKQLLDAAMQRFANEGVEDIYLEVRENNAAAFGLYEKYGFSAKGTRRKYYNSGHDAVIMSLNNKQDPV